MKMRMAWNRAPLRGCFFLALCWMLVFLLAVVPAHGAEDVEGDEPSVPQLSAVNGWDILAILFMSLGLALAAAGGVGGGPIIVPVLVLMMGFDIKHATPVSNVIIIGGAIANAAFNLRRRHPSVDRPLIDPDISLAMIPPIIGGAVLGAFISKLLPAYIISLLFVVVLIAGATRTLQKGLRLHKRETAKRKEQELPVVEDIIITPPFAELDASPKGIQGADVQSKDEESGDPNERPPAGTGLHGQRLAQILEEERHFSWTKHGVILLCYIGIVAASVVGNLLPCGGVGYWILLVGEIPWVLLFAVASGVYLTRRNHLKHEISYPFADGDVNWTTKSVIWFPLLCAGAGIIAGLFGIGGGIICGPVMIEMAVRPEVASATTALMVLYASAAATVKFAVFDMIAWDWAATLGAVALVVTFFAQLYVVGFVRKSGRESIIVLCIGASIAIGAILMTYQAIKSTIDDSGKPFTADICKVTA